MGTGGPWACGEPCPGASAGECQHFHQQKLSRRPPAEAPRGCWCDTSRLGVVASVPRGAGPTGQRRSHGSRGHRCARRRRLGQHVPSKENPCRRQHLARALSGLRADLQSQLRGLKCAHTHVHTPLRGQRCAHTHTCTHTGVTCTHAHTCNTLRQACGCSWVPVRRACPGRREGHSGQTGRAGREPRPLPVAETRATLLCPGFWAGHTPSGSRSETGG